MKSKKIGKTNVEINLSSWLGILARISDYYVVPV